MRPFIRFLFLFTVRHILFFVFFNVNMRERGTALFRLDLDILVYTTVGSGQSKTNYSRTLPIISVYFQ